MDSAGHLLNFGSNLKGFLLSDPELMPLVEKFVSSSPDRTVHHQTPYIAFSRARNGSGDLLLVTKSGAPQFAIPLHPKGRFFFSTGYSGILFPDTSQESKLKDCVASLQAFLDANRHVGFHCIQAVPAPAYNNRDRMSLLDFLLSCSGVTRNEIFSRVLMIKDIDDSGLAAPITTGSLDPRILDNALLHHYDPDVRNQIRQAIRNNLTVDYFVLGPRTPNETLQTAYDLYAPVHTESWKRTGMVPHALEFWTAFSRAICDSGGTDLVVLSRSPEGKPIAGVTCQVYENRAIYWSGCSLVEGMNKRANPLTLHAAITLCRNLGAEAFELGRMDCADVSSKERTVNQYKAQFRGSMIRVVNFRREPSGFRYRAFSAASRIKRGLQSLVPGTRN